MKPVLTLLGFLLLPGFIALPAFSQDAAVREEAERLLEHAAQVSSSTSLPNWERTETFRVFDADGVREGSLSRVLIKGTGQRDEYNFGSFHNVDVLRNHALAQSGTGGLLPPELALLERITPLYMVRFDHEDVIHSIVNREVSGHAARCIEFDTIRGVQSQSNELCVDSQSGALVLEQLNGKLIENSDFFSVAGGLNPATIRYSVGGILKMEITQTITELKDPAPNLLLAPPDAEFRKLCTTFRRAFGVSMPQPKPGNGGGEADIIVSVGIGSNGLVYDAVVLDSDRPDLNAEGLALARQWVFTPALCNGAPREAAASIELHFQGR